MTRGVKNGALFFCLLLAFATAVRVVSIDADPPSWLSWSSGIYSDEGIYASDARSLALFGHWSPGDFHSAEIAPLHTVCLLCIFKLSGCSLSVVRSLGIFSSLITVLVFYLSLKKQFDPQTALVGSLYLSISPFYVFYSRLGLMEVPTVCLLVCAYYLIVHSKPDWLVGLVLAMAVIYKPLAVLCVPSFFLDFRTDYRATVKRCIGLAIGLAAYYAIWQFPHRKDLGRLNHYYLAHQYSPHSLTNLGHNLVRSLWSGSSDGVLPYLIHHEPLLIILSVLTLTRSALRRDRSLKTLWLWFVIPVVAFCIVSYEPSRYFVLVWPPLAALSAVATCALPVFWKRTAVSVFATTSLAVIVVSLTQSTFFVEMAGRSITTMVTPSTTIIGQYAPELSLCNRLKSVYVQPELANSNSDLKSDEVALVTASPYWSNYWGKRTGASINSESDIYLKLPKGQRILIIR